MGIHKCHASCLWTLLLALVLAVVPRYAEIELRTEAMSAPAGPLPVFEFADGAFERNETLSTTLASHGVDHETAYSVAQAVEPVFNVRNFRPGQAFRLVKEPSGRLVAFEYTIDDERVLKVNGEDSGRYRAHVEELPLEARTETISTDVVSSLWEALADSPKGDWLVMELARIFEAQVDFYRDIRPGDSIRLIVETRHHRGDFVKYGGVHAAEFVNQGKAMRAFKFRDEYYDENGMSVRRSLLPSPLEFTRISSGYTNARLHPIYKTVRPHRGIDYAAPTGTPVWAVADGTVTFAGTNGGFGRMVTVRHTNGMTTSYAHLSRIKVNVGQRVKQRDEVGLVGMTGTATGPHLDYRMTVNGRTVNPRTVRADPPKPIDPALKDDYLMSIAGLQDDLRGLAVMSGN